MKMCLLLVFNFLFFFAYAQETVPSSIYDFKIAGLNGNTIDLAQYKGKKILIVNTPINTDNARQYSELEALYQKYKDRLVVIGVLANDFAIEPGSNKTNLAKREKHYDVTFPQAAKELVRTDEMSPLFKWLTEKKYNNLRDNEVKWDFQKYLINEKGVLIAIFDPKIKADNPQLISAITN
jgi:glutathione peroxidase